MAYLQHTGWRERPGAVIGVVAIHAAIGYALINGLNATGVADVVKKTESFFVPEVKLPPPPPPPEPTVEPETKVTNPPLHVPIAPIDLGPKDSPVVTTPEILPTPDFVPSTVPTATPGPIERPKPRFDPVAARPRNNPGSWVTEADYRSSWINREMTGLARFTISVGASGRVEKCTITGSSGHPELDNATCDLVTKRAKFEPAKDTNGAATGGTYASSVRWVLPE